MTLADGKEIKETHLTCDVCGADYDLPLRMATTEFRGANYGLLAKEDPASYNVRVASALGQPSIEPANEPMKKTRGRQRHGGVCTCTS